MTNKNIQDVVAELKTEFIETQCKEMEGEEDLCEVYENDGELVADWWVEKITQLVKEVEAGERERIIKVVMGMTDDVQKYWNEDAWESYFEDRGYKYGPKGFIEALTPPTSDVIEK